MVDGFSARYSDLLYGSYDCVDRIVLDAYHTLCYQPGGFRTWWRRLHGDDEQLDNAHLMRMAGRFARRGPGLGPGARDPGHRLRARRTQGLAGRPHRPREDREPGSRPGRSPRPAYGRPCMRRNRRLVMSGQGASWGPILHSRNA